MHFEFWGVLILLIAAATDWADGYFARRNSQVTTLGILLDPIADKLLITAAFISLVDMHLVPAWMVVIIIGREFTIMGLRNIASAEGFTIAASTLGKTKMVLQVCAAAVLIAGVGHPSLKPLGLVLLWLVVVSALVSAGQYFLPVLESTGRPHQATTEAERDWKHGRSRRMPCLSEDGTEKHPGSGAPGITEAVCGGRLTQRHSPDRHFGTPVRSIRDAACGRETARLHRGD